MNLEKQVFTQIIDTYRSAAHTIAAERDCEGPLTTSAHIHTQTSLLIYMCWQHLVKILCGLFLSLHSQ